MAYDFSDFKKQKDDIIAWLQKEFSSIRTGRATVTLLDSVMVESYGVRTPLNQTANISIEDSRTIRIAPWDKSLIPEIERAIAKIDLGVSTSADGEGVRVKFPELTTENREKLVKLAKVKTEEAKVSLRNERAVIIKDIEAGEKEGDISEDDARRHKDDLQKMIEETQKTLEDMTKKKEAEIMS